MSRVTKWKLEKTKVKVVFRLQFHAIHIPQTGWDKLYISLTPAESGKATAKTTKANVRNGTCKWGDPIYETTRLLQDVKTKQLEEKLYKLVVAMGSSRSSVLGEASINLAEYADALKPTVVQLPLKGSSDSGAVLHVTVQLLTSKTGFREFEQQREISERGLQASSDHDGSRVSLSGDTIDSHIDKDDARGIQAVSLESTSSHGKTLSPSIDQSKAQNLKSSMDFLHKELEKMKSENSLLSEDDFEPQMEGLRRELIQLEKVNEELQNMSPEFKDFSSYGNSIERVLALVMELAEALQAKKTSTLQFQSSFLKLHNDETAVFRSFKDINDLIKDMLDLKGKYNAVETELREMHNRYSELSIQFAEVEGERQKLMMTLKNTRSPRRLSGWGSPGGPAS